MIAFGLAVVPLVYSRYNMSSESIGSHAQVLGSALMPSSMSSAQTSRPFVMSTSPPVRLTTMHVFSAGEDSMAASELALSGTRLPRRQPSSCVMRNVHSMSFSLPDSDSPLPPAPPPPKGHDLGRGARLAGGVDAVVANVQLAADEPLRIRRLPFVQLFPGLEEGDALRLLSPEVVEALVVDVGLGVGLLAELGVGRIATDLDLHGLDGVLARAAATHVLTNLPQTRRGRPRRRPAPDVLSRLGSPRGSGCPSWPAACGYHRSGRLSPGTWAG